MNMLALMSTLLLTMMFASTHSPLFMTMSITASTLVIAVVLFTFSKTSWFSFTLMIVFISAMMVLFSYISTIAPNDTTSFDKNKTITLLLILSAMVLYFPPLTSEPTHALSTLLETQTPLNELLSKMYSQSMALITTLAMAYLLITLIVVVKVAALKEGPLRAALNPL